MGKAKILIVEDEGIVGKDIQSRLKKLGYDVPYIVLSGKRAIKIASEIQPDLVLMDVKLKGSMDGIEAAEQIRAHEDIPIVYLTAYADEKTLKRAKITEPYGYLLKPFEERDLHSAVEIALYKHNMENKLKEKEKWFSTTLRSIGDGVMATDGKGRLTFMNPIAEKLTGWKQKDALGKDLTKVFTIIDEEKNNPPKSLVTKVIQDKIEVIHADNSLLISKNGKVIPVDVRAAPIKSDKDRVIGVVLIFTDIGESKLAGQELKQNYVRLQKTLEGTVNALALVSEKRDPYTAGHQQRVAQLATAIAREIGLSEDKICGLQMAAVIHDIGKIYIPAEILSKPGRLTKIEFSMIKSHPQVGFDILKNIEFPWPVAEIVLQHHERINGSGYPLGLNNEDILIEAKILAVADVVEAMSFHRPYRPAYGIMNALEEVVQNKGILFDSRIVDACLRLFTEKEFEFEKSKLYFSYFKDLDKEEIVRI